MLPKDTSPVSVIITELSTPKLYGPSYAIVISGIEFWEE